MDVSCSMYFFKSWEVTILRAQVVPIWKWPTGRAYTLNWYRCQQQHHSSSSFFFGCTTFRFHALLRAVIFSLSTWSTFIYLKLDYTLTYYIQYCLSVIIIIIYCCYQYITETIVKRNFGFFLRLFVCLKTKTYRLIIIIITNDQLHLVGMFTDFQFRNSIMSNYVVSAMWIVRSGYHHNKTIRWPENWVFSASDSVTDVRVIRDENKVLWWPNIGKTFSILFLSDSFHEYPWVDVENWAR